MSPHLKRAVGLMLSSRILEGDGKAPGYFLRMLKGGAAAPGGAALLSPPKGMGMRCYRES